MNMPHTDLPDRRPIRSRSSRWAGVTTDTLIKAGLSPNAISVIGMLFAIAAGLVLAATDHVDGESARRAMFFVAGVLIVLRLLANLFDGMVAVQRGIASSMGELYNEVPDRVSDAVVLIGAGYALGGSVVMGYVAAVLAVFIAYVRAVCRLAGAPMDYQGPMAKPHRMWTVVAACALAAVLPTGWQQWLTTTAYMPGSFGIMAGALAIIILGSVITIVRRLAAAGGCLQPPKSNDTTTQGDPH